MKRIAMLLVAIGVIAQDDWLLSGDGLSKENSTALTRTISAADDVYTANLLYALDLTEAQAKRLVEIADDIDRMRNDFLAKNGEKLKNAAIVMEKYKVTAAKGDYDKELMKELSRIESDVNSLVKEYKSAIAKKVLSITAVLNRRQSLVMVNFRKSLVPSKPAVIEDEKSDYDELYTHLTHFRNMTEKAFNALAKPAAVQVIKEHWAPVLGDFAQDEIETEANRIVTVLRKSRELNDDQFMIHREDVARELLAPLINVGAMYLDQNSNSDKIIATAKFLFTGSALKIVKERIASGTFAKTTAETPMEETKDEYCACGEPTIYWFARKYGIPAEKVEEARIILGRMQIKVLNLLSTADENGNVPLVKVIIDRDAGYLEKWFALTDKESGMSNGQLIESMKKELQRELGKFMTKEDFMDFVDSNIDMMKIHAGNLNNIK